MSKLNKQYTAFGKVDQTITLGHRRFWGIRPDVKGAGGR